jgi:hypothetical protein
VCWSARCSLSEGKVSKLKDLPLSPIFFSVVRCFFDSFLSVLMSFVLIFSKDSTPKFFDSASVWQCI